MSNSGKPPKTFVFYVEKNGKRGYVRMRSYVTGGKIELSPTVVKNISDASRYVTFENSKAKAAELLEICAFDKLEIVDDATKKRHVMR